jgi:CheY-like chemotaxis protein
MAETRLPRILVVDDEEAILETMTFTFEGEYEVFTSTDARRALEILEEKSPIAVVLTDQRMPNMSGVEFLAEVCRRHPDTVRMILTGFADLEAILEAINDGHVYAYITKPWEPDHLKQLMKQAVERYRLTVENERLLVHLQQANVFLEAVMDELDVGAIALDGAGVVRAVNRPVRDYLALEGDPRGRPLGEVLGHRGLERVGAAAWRLAGGEAPRRPAEPRGAPRAGEAPGARSGAGRAPANFEDVEVSVGGSAHRLRVTVKGLGDDGARGIGRVVFLREISHEPMQRRFIDAVNDVVAGEGEVRPRLEAAREQVRAVREELARSRVASPGMAELGERVSRALTALENWLDVDDALAGEDYPDAQLLQDRMRVALARWPLADEVPEPVRELARRVEEYYESGHNPKQHVL